MVIAVAKVARISLGNVFVVYVTPALLQLLAARSVVHSTVPVTPEAVRLNGYVTDNKSSDKVRMRFGTAALVGFVPK